MAKVDLKSCIKTAKEIAEDHEYKIKASRNPKNKRLAQTSYNFWQSIYEHLENYQKTLDSEFKDKHDFVKQDLANKMVASPDSMN